jgi:DNA-binding winged helix-turn-helix (wHTH) protein/tetratricopeptide (TPR) repeat protein
MSDAPVEDAPARVTESASTSALEPAQYRFGPFHLDVATRALYRGSEFVALTPKAAEILLVLLRDAGRVVTKEQLLEQVWPGLVIEEGAIASNISALRKVLDPEFGSDGPIATVPRRGYRFTASVAATGGPEGKAAAREAAQGEPLINERDTILVAEIDNQTGEAVFDGTIRQALLLHLAQSPFLEVLTDRKVRSLLGYLGKQDAKVAGEVALEVGQRGGSKAVITGSIFALGEDFLIGLQALDSESGGVLVTEQARAHGKGEVLHALDQAAVGLRTKLGESLASVRRFSRPFDEVATASLEAFRAYSLGRTQWTEVGENAGIPHLQRAIELDPDFASAYSALALCCNNLGLIGEAGRYMQKAYALRDRATERERVRIVAGYHDNVSGDVFKGIDAHRLWERSYPRDAAASMNLGNLYAILGQWEKALASAQRGYSLEATNVSTSNLAIALLANGRHEEARAILEDGFARGFDAFYLHLDAYQEAFLRGDSKAMQRHVDAVSGRAGEEDYLIATQADTEAFFGRHERARELSRRAVESARAAGVLEMAALWAAQAAMREAELGEADRARKGAEEALVIAGGRYVSCVAGYALARSGDGAAAHAIMESLEREHPHTAVQRYWIPCMQAALAMHGQQWKEAVEALEPALAVELGLCMPFECGFMLPAWLRGVALKRLGRAEEAAAELTKIVEKPGLVKNYLVLPLARAQLD